MSLKHQLRRSTWSLSALAVIGLFIGSHAKLVRADDMPLAACPSPPTADSQRDPLPSVHALEWRDLLPAAMPTIRVK